MELPKTLGDKFWDDVQAIEKEKKMPFVTTGERIGMEKGRVQGVRKALAVTLESKFGAHGKKLLPRIRRIEDPDALVALLRALHAAASLDDFRQALP